MDLIRFYKKEYIDLFRFRWVTYSIVQTNLLVRYKRSFLGFFWSLLGPIVSFGTIAMVFYFGLRVRNSNYIALFFPAVVLFSFINVGISQSANSIRVNEHYIKKIYLPKSLFVLNSVLTEVTTFVFNLLAVTLVGVLLGKMALSFKMLLFPFLFLPAFFFVFGVGLIFSVVTIFFRDLAHVIPLVMQASFYLTPILYDPSQMPKKLQWLIWLNPLSHFIETFRWCFVEKEFPLDHFGISVAWAVSMFLIGSLVLKKNDNRIVYKL